MAKLELPDSVRILNPKPVNFWYDNDGTPWTNIAAALVGVPLSVRHYGLTVNINNTEYWWKDVLDADPVIKPADLYSEHDQQTPSATWNVTHNLGKYPSVMIIDSVNNHVEGDIEYLTVNTLTITFTSAFSGKAYMN